jgi:hypothetical protein
MAPEQWSGPLLFLNCIRDATFSSFLYNSQLITITRESNIKKPGKFIGRVELSIDKISQLLLRIIPNN